MNTFPGVMVSVLSDNVNVVDIILTDDLFLSYCRLIVRFVRCHIQKAAKQIIAFLHFTRIPASFHHFQHVFLLEGMGHG